MQFDFGKNWARFSRNALNSEKVDQARSDFATLMQGVEIRGNSFLDIGFGQGLSLLIAAEIGASVVGCDINPKCREVLEQNKQYFPDIAQEEIPVIIGSILDEGVVAELRKASPDQNGVNNIVHSWGVLHHTGDMRKAILNAASLVKPGGYLVLAIYNRHWTSLIWLFIKWFYNKSPALIRKSMIALLYPVIYLAKLAVTRNDPKKQKRGMDFYYNVVDWVGGYPYEYATTGEIEEMLARSGFRPIQMIPAQVPTGCNEFVFIRK
ncbi:MAG: class I SAM-dependent methyltransferase [Desulfobacteraceae bacterium]|nr:class I SAM-dependent methyltransferase [Desulfobacteraceae bacterium]